MPNKGLVSVVMPVFNGAQYLKDAIYSIQQQTYSHWELIVVDDGSKDETKNILHSLAQYDQRMRLYGHDSNRGLPASLNTGLQHARGEWIARMDSDDLAAPERFETQIDFLIKNPEYGLAGSQGWLIDERGGKQQESKFPTEHQACIDAIVKGESPFFHSSWMLTYRCFEKVGFYNSWLFSGEDKDYWLRVSEQCKVGNLNQNLLQYRIHNAAFTTRTISQRKFYRKLIIDLYNQRKEKGRDFLNGHWGSKLTNNTEPSVKTNLIMQSMVNANALVGTSKVGSFLRQILSGLKAGWSKGYTWNLSFSLIGFYLFYVFKYGRKLFFK